MEKMQQTATKVFIVTSVAFGMVGVLLVLVEPNPGDNSTDFNVLLSRLLMALIFVILPSFALSVAGKYLAGKK